MRDKIETFIGVISCLFLLACLTMCTVGLATQTPVYGNYIIYVDGYPYCVESLEYTEDGYVKFFARGKHMMAKGNVLITDTSDTGICWRT